MTYDSDILSKLMYFDLESNCTDTLLIFGYFFVYVVSLNYVASMLELFYLVCVKSLSSVIDFFCSVIIKRVIISIPENGSTKQRSFQLPMKTYVFMFLLFVLIVFSTSYWSLLQMY